MYVNIPFSLANTSLDIDQTISRLNNKGDHIILN